MRVYSIRRFTGTYYPNLAIRVGEHRSDARQLKHTPLKWPCQWVVRYPTACERDLIPTILLSQLLAAQLSQFAQERRHGQSLNKDGRGDYGEADGDDVFASGEFGGES